MTPKVEIEYAPWYVVTMRTRERSHPAVLLQRVQVPPREAPERRVADPRYVMRVAWPKRGVKSLYGGSQRAGRNFK
jgi:hypothetical protein